MEFSVLPLRLATPAAIHIDALWFRAWTKPEAMQQGLDQPAPEPYGETFFVELSSAQCASLERALPYLQYAEVFTN